MHPGLISIESQIAAMAERWPGFRVIERDDRYAVWQGRLQPLQRYYTVRIGYRVPLAIEAFSLLQVQPRVQVLDPVLERHSDYEEGPIPHVYVNRDEPILPYLCLFDAYNCEWTPSDLLAATTVPWSSRYLFFYEGWLATKTWRGGGRHPTREERDGIATEKAIAAV
jgi:hypothetical protein